MNRGQGQLQVRAFYLDDTGAEQQFVITFTEDADRLILKQSQIRTSIKAYMSLTAGTLLSVQLEVMTAHSYTAGSESGDRREGKVLSFRRERDLDIEL